MSGIVIVVVFDFITLNQTLTNPSSISYVSSVTVYSASLVPMLVLEKTVDVVLVSNKSDCVGCFAVNVNTMASEELVGVQA